MCTSGDSGSIYSLLDNSVLWILNTHRESQTVQCMKIFNVQRSYYYTYEGVWNSKTVQCGEVFNVLRCSVR